MGVFLARRQDPNLGFPFPTESGLECEPSFGLAPLAGCRWHVANYLDHRPFIAYRCVLVRTNIATNTAQPFALYRDRSLRDRPRVLPPGFHPFPYYPTSVLEHLTSNTEAGCSPIWCRPQSKLRRHISVSIIYLPAPRRGTGPPRRVPPCT